MATNSSSQMGLIPSETIVEDNANEPNLSQMMSTGIVITSQPIIPSNRNPMIAPPRITINNGQQRDTLTRRQLGRRRRRRRQRQWRRLRREEQRRLQQPQQQQRFQQAQQQQQLLRQGRSEQRETEQQQQQRQRTHELENDQPIARYRPSLLQSDFEDEWDRFRRALYHFSDLMNDSSSDSLFESYEFERMDPQQRWEEEQIHELEALAAFDQQLIREYEQNEPNRMTSRQTAEDDDEQTI